MKHYYVYILTNQTHKVLYIGMTNDLLRRVFEHKNKIAKGFTAKYNITKLVYYEQFSDVSEAIYREKQLKKWKREKKEYLIFSMNPNWNDLSEIWFV
ncbi:MAG: GIY-YIG nuclease family protein [Calditrichia bacterium]